MKLRMALRRGLYIVEGRRFDFENVLAQSGLDAERESLRMEQLKDSLLGERKEGIESDRRRE